MLPYIYEGFLIVGLPAVIGIGLGFFVNTFLGFLVFIILAASFFFGSLLNQGVIFSIISFFTGIITVAAVFHFLVFVLNKFEEIKHKIVAIRKKQD